MTAVDGVLVVDKPAGPTSHDIVLEVRRLLPRRTRVGHTGTLDPAATGVLPLCLGSATRLSRFLTATRKLYSGIIHLGVSTDTYDADGQITARRDAGGIDPAAIRSAAASLAQSVTQVPPVFSARKVSGEPMHRLARRGVSLSPDPATVTIHRLVILSVDMPEVAFEAETSPGTYIRSLAHDLGEALGCGAHLASLRRTASGRFTMQQAHTMDEIFAGARHRRLIELIVPAARLDLGMPTVVAGPTGVRAMRHGRGLGFADLTTPASEVIGLGAASRVRILDDSGQLLGVAVLSGPGGADVLRPEVVLAV